MANATITVLEADGTTETDVVVLDVGRQAAAASKSVAASTEDKAVLDAIAASASVLDDWDESDRAKVNLIAGQAGITAGSGAIAANTPRIALATDSPGVSTNHTTAQTVNAGAILVTLPTDVALPTGTNTIGKVNILPETSGGLSLFRSIDLDETEEEVKATAGQVYSMWVSNLATSTRFLKFYNATAANVTVGTTTPVLTIAIPGNSSDDVSGFFGSAHGIAFGTAITVAATTGVADNDTGAPGANEVLVNIFYK